MCCMDYSHSTALQTASSSPRVTFSEDFFFYLSHHPCHRLFIFYTPTPPPIRLPCNFHYGDASGSVTTGLRLFLFSFILLKPFPSEKHSNGVLILTLRQQWSPSPSERCFCWWLESGRSGSPAWSDCGAPAFAADSVSALGDWANQRNKYFTKAMVLELKLVRVGVAFFILVMAS